MRSWLLLMLACGACAEASRVQTTPPWPAEHTAVIVPLDANGVPRSSGLRLLVPGEAVDLTLDEDELGARVMAGSWPAPPVGPDLEGCTLALGEGEEMLPDGMWWTTAPIERDAAIVWAPTPQGVPVRAACPVRDTTCAGVAVAAVDVGVTYQPLWAVLAREDGAIVGSADVAPRDESALLMRVDATGRRETLSSTTVRGQVRELIEVGGDVYGLTGRGDVFVWRGRGPVERIAEVGAANHLWGLAPDLLLVQRTSTAAAPFVELDLGGRVTAERRDVPPGIRVGALVSERREYMASSDGSIYRGDRRGNWSKEHTVMPDPEFSSFAAKDAVAFVSQRYLGVLTRLDDGSWLDVGRPGFAFTTAMGVLPGGGVVMVTLAGGVGIWDGRRWCTVAVPTRLDLNAVSVAPDGRTVWVAGDNDDRNEPPVLLRLDVSAR